MPTDIHVPTLGESVTTATIARWLKKAGDSVAADEPLVELETDKVTVEVNAPKAGHLASITAPEGAEVEVGALLGTMEDGAGRAQSASTPGVAASGAAPGKPESAVTAPASSPAPAANPSAGVNPPPPPSGPVTGAAQAHAPFPSAAKMMTENRVGAEQVGTGSGKDGRVTKGDVLDFLARPRPAPVPARAPAERQPAEGEERVRMTRLRKTIATRLKDAQNTAAMLTTFNEVDMSAAMAMRAQFKDAFEKRHNGTRLGFMGFFVQACVAALKEFPAVNAEIDGDDIVYKHHVHMGIAIGGANGLVVPVIRNIDRMDLAGVERSIADFGKRARDGALKIDELSGGTFSITNGGVYGSLMSTPILNPPQSGILGMHKIQDRPVAIAGKVEIRPMMYLALSYDHRIVDGKEAVSFLVRVKEAVEDPRRLLLGL